MSNDRRLLRSTRRRALGGSAGWIVLGLVLRGTVRYPACSSFPASFLALLGYLVVTFIVLMITETEVVRVAPSSLRTIVRWTALGALVLVVSGCVAAPDQYCD